MPNNYFPIHPEQSPRLGSYAGVPLREDTAYTNHKGEEKKGIRKRTEKTVDKPQEALRRMLEPEEVVFYLASAQVAATALEQFVFGWRSYYLSSGVLVFTNRRLLHLLVARNGTWKRSIRGARWGDLGEAKVIGWLSPTFQIRYRNRTKETYWRLLREDVNMVKVLFAALLPASTGETAPAQGMAFLCPECRTPLTPADYHCVRCGLDFKDEKTMARRSLLIPG